MYAAHAFVCVYITAAHKSHYTKTKRNTRFLFGFFLIRIIFIFSFCFSTTKQSCYNTNFLFFFCLTIFRIRILISIPRVNNTRWGRGEILIQLRGRRSNQRFGFARILFKLHSEIVWYKMIFLYCYIIRIIDNKPPIL